jgi:hypothetical protein
MICLANTSMFVELAGLKAGFASQAHRTLAKYYLWRNVLCRNVLIHNVLPYNEPTYWCPCHGPTPQCHSARSTGVSLLGEAPMLQWGQLIKATIAATVTAD